MEQINDFEQLINRLFDSETRVVLFEKAPFMIQVKTISSGLYLAGFNPGSYMMVRPLTRYEWQKVMEGNENFSNYNKHKYYIIVDFGLKDFPTNNLNDIGCWIDKKNCILIDSIGPLKPKEVIKGIREWFPSGAIDIKATHINR